VDTSTYSVIFTGSVGLAGLVFGAAGARATRRAHSADKAADREHERLLARDARLFERRANAYEGVMKVCDFHMQTVESRNPIIVPGPTAPTFPGDEEEEMLSRSRFSTYASPEADEALESFLKQTLAFYICADLYEHVREHGSPDSAPLKEMNKAREEVRARFGEVKVRIREELAAV
jgi:hypothetical protein